MNAGAVALRVAAAALLSSSFLPLPAAALDPERQPIYANITNGSLCGIHAPPFLPVPCQVPSGQRLVIEHVSGYVFQPASSATTYPVSIVITDADLGLQGGAFHTFVATKVSTSGGTDVFAFNTPFRVMLHPGATFHFSPSDNVAVSGYLVRE